ncbi:MAG: DUF962 domain-containing protein [Proteobacteria bacterium]|nr:DUF962 domain-containing protein [Pseudomonadota bacterium]
MTDTERWLAEYGDNHSRTGNRVLHWIAVPLFIFGTVGLLWSLPIPDAFLKISPLLNWGITFLMAAEVYYFIISISLALGMLPLVVATATLIVLLSTAVTSLLWLSIAMLTLGIAGLYLAKGSGRDIHGLARDMQLIMIAPIWLLARLYRRTGIPY